MIKIIFVWLDENYFHDIVLLIAQILQHLSTKYFQGSFLLSLSSNCVSLVIKQLDKIGQRCFSQNKHFYNFKLSQEGDLPSLAGCCQKNIHVISDYRRSLNVTKQRERLIHVSKHSRSTCYTVQTLPSREICISYWQRCLKALLSISPNSSYM